MCPEALLKVGGNAYITLGGNRKALEKIDTLHDCPPKPWRRGTPFALKWCCIPTSSGGKIGLPPEALAKGGGADRDRTDDLLNAIQALSQLSYGPTFGENECEESGVRVRNSVGKVKP